MRRAVRRRKSANERQRTIINAIVEQTIQKGGHSTLASIARRIGLSPSTYLLNVLKSMEIQGKIRHTIVRDKRKRNVFHWHVIEYSNEELDPPWAHEGSDYNQMAFKLKLGSRMNE